VKSRKYRQKTRADCRRYFVRFRRKRNTRPELYTETGAKFVDDRTIRIITVSASRVIVQTFHVNGDGLNVLIGHRIRIRSEGRRKRWLGFSRNISMVERGKKTERTRYDLAGTGLKFTIRDAADTCVNANFDNVVVIICRYGALNLHFLHPVPPVLPVRDSKPPSTECIFFFRNEIIPIIKFLDHLVLSNERPRNK